MKYLTGVLIVIIAWAFFWALGGKQTHLHTHTLPLLCVLNNSEQFSSGFSSILAQWNFLLTFSILYNFKIFTCFTLDVSFDNYLLVRRINFECMHTLCISSFIISKVIKIFKLLFLFSLQLILLFHFFFTFKFVIRIGGDMKWEF